MFRLFLSKSRQYWNHFFFFLASANGTTVLNIPPALKGLEISRAIARIQLKAEFEFNNYFIDELTEQRRFLWRIPMIPFIKIIINLFKGFQANVPWIHYFWITLQTELHDCVNRRSVSSGISAHSSIIHNCSWSFLKWVPLQNSLETYKPMTWYLLLKQKKN